MTRNEKISSFHDLAFLQAALSQRQPDCAYLINTLAGGGECCVLEGQLIQHGEFCLSSRTSRLGAGALLSRDSGCLLSFDYMDLDISLKPNTLLILLR